jgi:hypothetical protein
MFFLISNVVFGFCGSFFEKRGMPFQIMGKKAIVFGRRSYIGGAGERGLRYDKSLYRIARSLTGRAAAGKVRKDE